ncbi:beta-lactamase family protein [Lysobacter sp. 5GHs7-4]|uniref:serine hydrolase domain-containing protein n=1 Tax=Lysobacter sp. 5GHs7-4 TaxID=2904253 RepID=UPI001E637CB7|nr:serine hydrolase domain-containing protein [Lysobacter sp. 5GHs7-4]UHQ21185.1 beta-lactamase family protein [Lysobacter sp. 5GHs7-4]
MNRTPTTSPLRGWRICLRAWLLVWLLPVSGLGAAELDADLSATLRQQGLTGATWAVVDPQGVRVGAAGLKDARTGEPLRADHKVQVGSVTKTLLATGVLRLVSEGRLRLDQPVAELLPGIAFDNPWAATDPPRLRHLLDHTAGLDDARFSQVFSLRPTPDTPLAQAFAGQRGRLPVRSRPGTRVSYSNSGYTLLGMIVETLSGERYERYLDRELLRPLGMHDSSFGYADQRSDARLAMGHFEGGRTHPTVPMYLRPAGQFRTTAADMARYARFLMSDGRIAGRPFIDPTLLRGMGHPQGTEAAGAGLQVGYALGLLTRDRHGALGRCHGGSTVGYRAMLCLFPRQQRAFFVASNTDSETADYGALDRHLIQALNLPAAHAAPPRPSSLRLQDWEGHYVPAPNRFAAFAWLDTTLGFVRLRREGDGLRLLPFQGQAVALTPLGGALFRAPDRLLASHALLRATDGAQVIATASQSYQRIALWKLILLWTSLAVGALALVWLLLGGSLRAGWRRLRPRDPAFAPWLATLALLLPAPLLYRQSFLQLGDLTWGSGLLTAVGCALPLALAFGLWRHLRLRPKGAVAGIDAVAMLALLQWTLVLAAWGLWPLRLWA